eukprot:CAMPEP_0194142830 /NCGR_PEP_ID=MMETSP0152-20130528/12037_1 /TAXON_ID=1049557 /ORGANISM="Thalassiothrix antarctica, Strain L6-D1" /LENGTH=335 /DNA_ID=CAMNT_0038841933 /DNA_START=127 /DNA_END=1134 /DNA_ORIENTATION=-
MTDPPASRKRSTVSATNTTTSTSSITPLSSNANTPSSSTTTTTLTDSGGKKTRKRSATPSKSTSKSPGGKKDGKGEGQQKASKGLRHFSMKVCRKVEEKGKTTYNEVADELVREVLAERSENEPRGKYDEKNIRRRVYDALNVLMAMDIISKEKKEIRWKGLPTNAHHDLDMLQKEGKFREKEVRRKRESLRELLVQQVCFRNLVEHNRKRTPSSNEDSGSGGNDEKIPLPFIVVNTHNSAVIQCEMSPDRTDVMFDFSLPFEINDDNTILKRLQMDKATLPVLQEMLPPDMLQYCQEHGLVDTILVPEEGQQQQQHGIPPHPPSAHMPAESGFE